MEKEITMPELFQVLWRGRYIILGITALTLLAGIFYGFTLFTPSYRSSCLIDVSPYSYNVNQLLEKGQVLLQQEEFVNSVNKDLPPDVLNKVSLKIVPNTDMLKIDVAYSNPETAHQAAQVLGEKLLEWASLDKQKALMRQSRVLRTAINGMEAELAALENKASVDGTEYPAGTYPYEKLLSARSEVAAQLYTITANIEQLSTNPELQPANFVYPGKPPAAAATVQRLIYPAAALILGLLLSSLLVFLRYLWWSGIKDQSLN